MTFRKEHPTSSQLGPSTPTKRPTDLPSLHNRLTFFSRFQRVLLLSSSSPLPLWKRARAIPFIHSRFTPVSLSHRAHRERVRNSSRPNSTQTLLQFVLSRISFSPFGSPTQHPSSPFVGIVPLARFRDTISLRARCRAPPVRTSFLTRNGRMRTVFPKTAGNRASQTHRAGRQSG